MAGGGWSDAGSRSSRCAGSPLPAGVELCPSGAFVLPVPEWCRPETTAVPDADEVAPWVETIIRLWADAELWCACSAAGRRYAARWSAAELRATWLGLLGQLLGGSRCGRS